VGAIRLFLACVVAVAHLQLVVLAPKGLYIWGGFYLGFNAGYAVMAFYMISGFLISMVLSTKYEADRRGSSRFYINRFIRIFSLYLPISIVSFFAIDGTIRDFAIASPLQRLTSFTLLGSDWLIVAGGASDEKSWLALLNPLHQAWTLGPELTFYLLAPWLLRSRSACLFALLASFAIRITFVHTVGQNDTWTYIFLPSTFMFFLLGHFARVASTHYVQMYKPVVAYSLLGAGIVLLAFPPPAYWDTLRFWLAMFCVAGCLPGVFNDTKENALLNWLGSLSFPVYLVHNMVRGHFENIKYFDQLPHDWRQISVMAITYLISVLGAAIAAHYLLERPCANLMKATAGRLRSLLQPRAATDIGAKMMEKAQARVVRRTSSSR
jgi:peptidoglycan/LPS O-acetylase OafA/YrhL